MVNASLINPVPPFNKVKFPKTLPPVQFTFVELLLTVIAVLPDIVLKLFALVRLMEVAGVKLLLAVKLQPFKVIVVAFVVTSK